MQHIVKHVFVPEVKSFLRSNKVCQDPLDWSNDDKREEQMKTPMYKPIF